MTARIALVSLLTITWGACVTAASRKAAEVEGRYEATLAEVSAKHAAALEAGEISKAIVLLSEDFHYAYVASLGRTPSGAAPARQRDRRDIKRYAPELLDKAKVAWATLAQQNAAAIDALWERDPGAARALVEKHRWNAGAFLEADLSRLRSAGEGKASKDIARFAAATKALEAKGADAAALYYWAVVASQAKTNEVKRKAKRECERLERRLADKREKKLPIGVVGTTPNKTLAGHVEALNHLYIHGAEFREGRRSDDGATLTLSLTRMTTHTKLHRGEMTVHVSDGTEEVVNKARTQKQERCDDLRRAFDRYYEECESDSTSVSCGRSNELDDQWDQCIAERNKLPKTKTKTRYRSETRPGVHHIRHGAFRLEASLQSSREAALVTTLAKSYEGLDVASLSEADPSATPSVAATFERIYVIDALDDVAPFVRAFISAAHDTACPIDARAALTQGAAGWEAWYPYHAYEACQLDAEAITEHMVDALEGPDPIGVDYETFRQTLSALRRADG